MNKSPFLVVAIAFASVAPSALAYHPPSSYGYYPVWVMKCERNESAQENKQETGQKQEGFKPTQKSNGNDGGAKKSPSSTDDKNCSGEAAQKRELIDLQIKKLKLEIDRLEGKTPEADAESLATALTTISALPKAIYVLDDLRKKIRALRDGDDGDNNHDDEPHDDAGEIKELLDDIKGDIKTVRDNMVSKDDLEAKLKALEARIDEKLAKKQDK